MIDIMTTELSRLGVTDIWLPESQSAHVILLIYQLPRLQRLVLQYQGRELSNDMTHRIGLIETFPLRFQSLTHFSYETCYLSSGVSPKTLLFLLQLPHLRNLAVDVVNNIHRDLFADAGGTSGVTKLSLGYCMISAATLSLILTVPRALEDFTYQGDCVNGFVDVLLPLRPSLTHLHLDFGDSLNPGEVLNLHESPVLQTLRCSPAILLGEMVGVRAVERSLAEVLPVCIRQLALLHFSDALPWGDFGEVVDGVVQVLKIEWVVATLERLLVETGSPVFRARLRAACEATGVLLQDDCSSW